MDALKKAIKDTKLEFTKHNKRILRARKTKDVKKRILYMKEAISTYNKFINTINKYFEQIGYEDKSTVRQAFVDFKNQIFKYIGAYNITNFPEPSDGHRRIEIDDSQLEALIQTGLIPDQTPNNSENELESFDDSKQTTMTAISNIDFINLCARHMPSNYDGGFDTLRSFINKINFLAALATNAELKLRSKRIY